MSGVSKMPKGLQDMIQIDKILEREEKRFKEYGCVCRDLTYGTAKHFTLSDRIKWRRTEKQFRSIAPLIELMSQRDKYTGEHSVRVALITYRICMLIEMSKYYRKMITLSAYVHDVGKISVPDGILHKEGPLTNEEYEEMKHHPQDGADLLGKQAKYSHLIDGVLYHQERWDGKGYPTGAAGEQIPFPARVIAIADSIDAMMSDRPYRQALTSEACYAEIEKNAKIMYDPQLVKIVIENWNYIIDGIYE